MLTLALLLNQAYYHSVICTFLYKKSWLVLKAVSLLKKTYDWSVDPFMPYISKFFSYNLHVKLVGRKCNVIPQINSQFDMREVLVWCHFFTICHRKKMAINYRKSKNKISFLKRNRYCFDTFLGRHHISQHLDTTLDISQRFLRFSF